MGNGRLVHGDDFLRDLVPPSYVLEPILQRGHICSLTALTGHGKSAFSHLMACYVCSGMGSDHLRARQKGQVLMLFGENADNARLQLKATCLYYGISEEDQRNIIVYPVGKGIDIAVHEIFEQAGHGQWGEFDFVDVDTSAAYFNGDEENSNTSMIEHAKEQRRLTRLPGSPGVFSNCHPTKSASRDNLVPRGGGSFLNELDGNITLWNDGALLSIGHNKLRGPPFDVITFRLVDQEITFDDGTTMQVPVAVPIGDQDALLTQHATDERDLLEAMTCNPQGSTRDWALAMGWKLGNGTANHVRVARTLRRLQDTRRIKQNGAKWIVL